MRMLFVSSLSLLPRVKVVDSSTSCLILRSTSGSQRATTMEMEMPVKNKLNDFSKRELQQAFNAIEKGKKTVVQVATDLGVHPSTIRYHMKEKTYVVVKNAA